MNDTPIRRRSTAVIVTRTLSAILLAKLLTMGIAGAVEPIKNPFVLPLPDQSVSAADDAWAPFINPGLGGQFQKFSIGYRFSSFDGQGSANHMVSANGAGFTIAYSLLNSRYDDSRGAAEKDRVHLFHLGKGFWLNDYIGIGLSGSMATSARADYNQYRSWSGGLVIRPFPWLSLGYAARDINQPLMGTSRIDRADTYSLSWRPFGDRITLSGDAERYQHAGPKTRYIGSMSARILGDISLRAMADNEKNFGWGIIFPFDASREQASTTILDYYGKKPHAGPLSTRGGIVFSGERYRRPLQTTRRVLTIRLAGPIDEMDTEEQFFAPKDITFHDLVQAISRAKSDPSVCAIVIKIDANPFGFGQIQEIRAVIRDFKKSGKRVMMLLNEPGNRSYYLATAGDIISMAPPALFTISALKAEVFFFKDALEKVGIRFESIKRGLYKSFDEPFTRSHLSPEYRENLNSLLTSLNSQYLGAIADDRKVATAVIDDLLNRRGFLIPDDALKKRFIDQIEYPDDALKKMIKGYGRNCFAVPLQRYIHEQVKSGTWGFVPEIAVVYAGGSIVQGGDESSGTGYSEITADESYKGFLRGVFQDSDVRAVVIRVNSGGGSALASDLMWYYLTELKKTNPKPVVFSFGDVAASGGYYIACTGDRIFANAGTITGSIGVVSGKLSLKELYSRVGINKDIIKLSEFADIFSEARTLGPREREILQRGVDFIYRQFTGKVMQARGIKPAAIPTVAEGRVFTGSQAGAKRLVDSIGTLLDAINHARQSAGITGQFRLRHVPKKKKQLADFLAGERMSTGELLKKQFLGDVRGMYEWLNWAKEPALYVVPYRIEIK